jgi:hypothetical protein
MSCIQFFFAFFCICMVTKVFVELKRKKCVAYPQKDFLFIKLITCKRLIFPSKCRKDFQFHLKTPKSILYNNCYKFFDKYVGHTIYFKFMFLGSHDSRLYFRPNVYIFELNINFLIDE